MAQFVASLITLFLVVPLILLGCAYLIFLERKVAAWTQDRIGPNRTNFSFGLLPFKGRQFGLGQALADGLKLFLKEDYTPPHADRVLFLLAPVIVIIPAMLGWAVLPWGGYYDYRGTLLNITVAPLSIGVIYILAIGSLAVYGVVVGGYASNNKYSFLGGLRATAQMLSYEIPMGLCVLIVILTTHGAVRTDLLVNEQAATPYTMPGLPITITGVWNIFFHPLLAVIFFTCILAECNRAPFDLAEAEQELVGGYHTEYSSMKWALFFLGEYMHMITGCGFFAVLFLGGWDLLPFVREFPLVGGLGIVALKFLVFVLKVLALLFVMMWVRWTLPRFRFDQLMRLAWRSLIPATLAALLVKGVLVYLHTSPIWYLVTDLAILGGMMAVAPLVPAGPPVNRRIPLAGSRFSPA